METLSKPVRYKATLAAKDQVTSKVFIARLELTEPKTLNFAAGQFVMLVINPKVSRAMTIASPPQESPTITICQDVSPMGPGSLWMINLKVGDLVEFMGPLGRFVIDPQSSRRSVFVATGTGIAPFRSMLFDGRRVWNQVGVDTALYWGLRFEEDLFWQPEFKALVANHPTLHYYLTLSRPGPNWSGLRGHTTEHVFTKEANLAQTDFYLCGNKAMILEMQQKLLEHNVPRIQIKTDPFF